MNNRPLSVRSKVNCLRPSLYKCKGLSPERVGSAKGLVLTLKLKTVQVPKAVDAVERSTFWEGDKKAFIFVKEWKMCFQVNLFLPWGISPPGVVETDRQQALPGSVATAGLGLPGLSRQLSATLSFPSLLWGTRCVCQNLRWLKIKRHFSKQVFQNIKLVNPKEVDKIFLKGEGIGAKPANPSTSKH